VIFAGLHSLAFISIRSVEISQPDTTTITGSDMAHRAEPSR
jgi:hypothetical protein